MRGCISLLLIANGRNLTQISFGNNGTLLAHKWDVQGGVLASGMTRPESLNNVSSTLPLFYISQVCFSLYWFHFQAGVFSHLEKMITRSTRLCAENIAMNNRKDMLPALLQAWLGEWWSAWASTSDWHDTGVKKGNNACSKDIYMWKNNKYKSLHIVTVILNTTQDTLVTYSHIFSF